MHIDYPGMQDEEDGDYKLEKELEDLFVGGDFVQETIVHSNKTPINSMENLPQLLAGN